MGVGLDAGQTGLARRAREPTAVGEAGAAVGEQLAKAAPQPVGEPLLRAALLGAGQGLQGRVGILDREPSAGGGARIIGADARSGSGTWTSTSRACTGSKPSPGGRWAAPSWTRTSTGGRVTAASRVVSMPVATALPIGPAFSAGRDTTEVPPAPASQRRRPDPAPQRST